MGRNTHTVEVDGLTLSLEPISDPSTGISPLGGVARFPQARDCEQIVCALEANPKALEDALSDSQGLLLLPGLNGISDDPELLVRLSRLCGPEVEDYKQTLTREHLIHPDAPEVLVLGNRPPSNRKPPPRPDPALTEDGELPVQFPHRRGWHTDQSFRRPPPDISLFYCVVPSLKGQGHTLFANGTTAYAALTPELKEQVENRSGLHALLGTGRSEEAILRGDEVKALLPHQQSQSQPLVRKHPVTGIPALYLCEDEQMDWLDGPIVGMQTGPHGDGAKLLYALISHYTHKDYVYAHDWEAGDLVIYDNRCLIHSATWYDETAHDRLMWRTTVRGNPGPEYAGEERSWIPASGLKPMSGL